MWKHTKIEVANLDSAKNRVLRKEFLLKTRHISYPSSSFLTPVKLSEKFHIEDLYKPFQKAKPKSLIVSKSGYISKNSSCLNSVRSKNSDDSFYIQAKNAFLNDRSSSFIMTPNPNTNHNSKFYSPSVRQKTAIPKLNSQDSRKSLVFSPQNKLFKVDVKLRKPIFSQVNKRSYEKYLGNELPYENNN
ncbi:unnamed protein product [Blepharisma stoltei]|uniref:Uncharacterized protein n=1 Tax=Blepharisma stoltei TaxID=1481888 RepID=A0AAU9JX96_9CILI|nr:unnamed protein product [Blepharisma stoltei]